MKAYQIFQALSPELGQSIFQDLRDNHRDVYKTTLASLATQRRLRPVFVQRKPAPKQILWLYQTCRLKPVDSVAENLLQVWLLKSHTEMLNQFLDVMEIEHDEDGTVEDLPEELDSALLKKAVDVLLESYEPEQVTLYLHVFQLQQAGGWEALTKLLAEDERVFWPSQVKEAEEKAAAQHKMAHEETAPRGADVASETETSTSEETSDSAEESKNAATPNEAETVG
ncbi:MAG: hypothetical protein AAGJ31_02045 [Verrucomicrobiota bacterium]